MNREDRGEQPRLKEAEFFSNKSEKEDLEAANFKELPDLGLEQAAENNQESRPEATASERSFAELGNQAAPMAASAAISDEEREREIESIMADGLEDAFLGLSADKRAEFKKSGEETAQKINKLLDKTKIKIKKIVDLLRKWLSLLPGAGKFFIEQEAKIRADKIAKLKE